PVGPAAFRAGVGARVGAARLPDIGRPYDNSNSQFGVMGVWAAAEAGIEVPLAYWETVGKHWRRDQSADGRWAYTRQQQGGTPSMTLAGVASAMVAHDNLHAAEFVNRFATVPFPREADLGIRWLDRDGNGLNIGGGHHGYSLFSLERVGRATGLKYLGGRDWYREQSVVLLDRQQPDGTWGNEVDTSFAVLFLSRGRAPILANKLRFEGRWCNRPGDLASAARHVSRTSERQVGWQVVNLDRPGTDWLDAPVLYIAGNQAPLMGAADYAKVAAYVRAGGMVFLHADGGSRPFADWARQVFLPRVCPGETMVPLPPTHGLYRSVAKLPPTIRLEAAGAAGPRVKVLLAPDDLAGAWQSRDDKGKPDQFNVMLNLWAYTTDPAARAGRAGVGLVPEPPPAEPPVARFPVARVRHAGNWDPEPGAWERFGQLFRWDTGAVVAPAPVAAPDLKPGAAPLAHLTGFGDTAFAPEEAAGMRAYVEGGGVLLVDACGGDAAFAAAVEERLFPAAFPGMSLQPADPASPPLVRTQPVTDDLSKRPLRPFAVGSADRRPRPILVGRFGKGWVVYSPMDLTVGLLGTDVSGVYGTTPAHCTGVVKNVLVWAATMRGGL
ncbi:MAG TPA: DUF4159 domain-containing protein, partial [Humisphaera sp.]